MAMNDRKQQIGVVVAGLVRDRHLVLGPLVPGQFHGFLIKGRVVPLTREAVALRLAAELDSLGRKFQRDGRLVLFVFPLADKQLREFRASLLPCCRT